MQKEERVKWYLRPVTVILLLFLVLGPFGLPLLYRSPGFTGKWKIILTLLVMAYTLYLVMITVDMARDFYRVFSY